MSHECFECGQECYCDGDDTHMGYEPDECYHQCEPETENHWEPLARDRHGGKGQQKPRPYWRAIP